MLSLLVLCCVMLGHNGLLAKAPCNRQPLVKIKSMFLTSDKHSTRLCASMSAPISHTKFAPGWVTIKLSFEPIQEVGLKVGGRCSIKSGDAFPRLQYMET